MEKKKNNMQKIEKIFKNTTQIVKHCGGYIILNGV